MGEPAGALQHWSVSSAPLAGAPYWRMGAGVRGKPGLYAHASVKRRATGVVKPRYRPWFAEGTTNVVYLNAHAIRGGVDRNLPAVFGYPYRQTLPSGKIALSSPAVIADEPLQTEQPPFGGGGLNAAALDRIALATAEFIDVGGMVRGAPRITSADRVRIARAATFRPADVVRPEQGFVGGLAVGARTIQGGVQYGNPLISGYGIATPRPTATIGGRPAITGEPNRTVLFDRGSGALMRSALNGAEIAGTPYQVLGAHIDGPARVAGQPQVWVAAGADVRMAEVRAERGYLGLHKPAGVALNHGSHFVREPVSGHLLQTLVASGELRIEQPQVSADDALVLAGGLPDLQRGYIGGVALNAASVNDAGYRFDAENWVGEQRVVQPRPKVTGNPVRYAYARGLGLNPPRPMVTDAGDGVRRRRISEQHFPFAPRPTRGFVGGVAFNMAAFREGEYRPGDALHGQPFLNRPGVINKLNQAPAVQLAPYVKRMRDRWSSRTAAHTLAGAGATLNAAPLAGDFDGALVWATGYPLYGAPELFYDPTFGSGEIFVTRPRIRGGARVDRPNVAGMPLLLAPRIDTARRPALVRSVRVDVDAWVFARPRMEWRGHLWGDTYASADVQGRETLHTQARSNVRTGAVRVDANAGRRLAAKADVGATARMVGDHMVPGDEKRTFYVGKRIGLAPDVRRTEVATLYKIIWAEELDAGAPRALVLHTTKGVRRTRPQGEPALAAQVTGDATQRMATTATVRANPDVRAGVANILNYTGSDVRGAPSVTGKPGLTANAQGDVFGGVPGLRGAPWFIPAPDSSERRIVAQPSLTGRANARFVLHRERRITGLSAFADVSIPVEPDDVAAEWRVLGLQPESRSVEVPIEDRVVIVGGNR